LTSALVGEGKLRVPTALPQKSLGGPQSRPGRCGEEENLGPIETRTPIPRPSSPQPVAIPTELSKLVEAVSDIGGHGGHRFRGIFTDVSEEISASFFRIEE
jgi:hypothetical protein